MRTIAFLQVREWNFREPIVHRRYGSPEEPADGKDASGPWPAGRDGLVSRRDEPGRQDRSGRHAGHSGRGPGCVAAWVAAATADVRDCDRRERPRSIGLNARIETTMPPRPSSRGGFLFGTTLPIRPGLPDPAQITLPTRRRIFRESRNRATESRLNSVLECGRSGGRWLLRQAILTHSPPTHSSPTAKPDDSHTDPLEGRSYRVRTYPIRTSCKSATATSF